MGKLTRRSSTTSSHRWKEKSNICDISLKDVLAKLTVEEAEGSSLDTKVDSVSEAGPEAEPEAGPEAEPEAGPEAGPEVGAQVNGTVVDSGAYKNFATTTTTVFFILSMYFS